MNDGRSLDKASGSDTEASLPQNETGTLVAWTESSGDSEKSHVVHVGPAGIALALGIKETAAFAQLVGQASSQPAEAVTLIEAQRNGRTLSREQLSRVAYTEGLSELMIIDDAGKKQYIAAGKEGEQAKIFEAVSQHLGGTASEEDADAWSVMKKPLFTLAVTAFFGGLMIYLASESDPNYEPTGRRSGIKALVNWLGYTIGPTWMSVIVGGIVSLVIAMMAFQLVNRPQRQVLTF